MCSQRIFTWKLWGALGMIDVENHIAFAYVKVPSDDRGGINDLNQHLVDEGEHEEEIAWDISKLMRKKVKSIMSKHKNEPLDIWVIQGQMS